jgi:FAD/FMN-containing dehydrogenase
VADITGPMPYVRMQSLVDAHWESGAYNFFRPGFLRGLEDGAIQALMDCMDRCGSPDSKIQIYQLGGAVGRVAAEESAFGQRDASHLLNVAARWMDPAESALHVAWANETDGAMRPLVTGRVYVNFLGEDGHDRVRAAYGADTYRRLVELKNRYDPTDLFRVNQNIRPEPGQRPPSS